MKIIQEAVDISRGQNFIPNRMRYRLPDQKNNVSVFLLSDSYEYDIELIKNNPQPKTAYKNIIVPFRVISKIGARPFRYIISQSEYNRKMIYLNNVKMIPKVFPIKYPYPSDVGNNSNIYISMSDIIPMITPIIRRYPKQYIQENIFDLFTKVMGFFNFTKKKILLIDTQRYKIYQNPSSDTYMSDIINALITAYLYVDENKIKKLDWIFIFRTPEVDYKFDLMTFDKRDVPRFRAMLRNIGKDSEIDTVDTDNIISSNDENERKDEDIESEPSEEIDEDKTVINQIQNNNTNVANSVKNSLDYLKTKYANLISDDNDENSTDSLYNAKTLNINAELIHRINPATNIVSNYKSITDDIEPIGDKPVEKELIKSAAKKLASDVVSNDNESSVNAVTSAREQKIREQVGRVKLNNISFNTIASITDVPKAAPLIPIKMTTTNRGAIQGTSFARVSEEYETKLLDRDIVSTFMNFSKLPNGFYVTDVNVSDISTVTTLMNNWRVTLKNKSSDKQSVINIRVPKVINGRFLNNGVWYNIGKQDFPLPILKTDKKTVLITSCYNKITCSRYDTRSLVDITLLTKVVDKVINDKGENKYARPGTSSHTNSRFISTVEYDEYARKWVYFKNKESDIVIYFNRAECAKHYSFVTVNENEFCCGMINKVPIVVNTETGLTRDGLTITETILKTLPSELIDQYKKQKPGKVSMYSEVKLVDAKIPLGVAIAAWEGMNSLLKKSGAKYKYIDSKTEKESGYFEIPFKDKKLLIQNTVTNQLIFNGFYRINTKSFNASDFEEPIMNPNSVFVDIFSQLFFRQFSQLSSFITFYNFFVDAITYNVCDHYNMPNDICSMMIYASKLLSDNSCSSENNASLYRIRSTEIIPAIIHCRLAMAISKYNNNPAAKLRGNSIEFNPNDVINELLAVPNVSTSSALNPMIELHEKETITRKGHKGLNVDQAYSLGIRSFEDSMIGKMAMSSPNSGNIGVNRQLVADPKIESIRGYTATKGIDSDFNDLQLASFSELLTPGTVSRDDAIRTAIATSQTSHIVSTAGAQPVLISNGVDEIVSTCLSENFSYVATDDGSVIDGDNDYIIIQYKNGKKKAINITARQEFNSGSGFYVCNKLLSNFSIGDKFKKGDVLAYHDKFFSKDSDGVVRMNIGPLAKVAFAGLYSTYEDAGLVTTKMSKKLASKLTMVESFKIDATDDIEKIVKIGDEVEINDPLIVFGVGDTGDKAVDNFLKAFQDRTDDKSILESSKRIKRAKNAGTVVDVRMYTIKSMEKLSPSLFNLFDNYFKENIKKRKILDKHDKTDSVYKLDTLYSLPTAPLKGSTIKGITCDVLIEIYIEHEDEASVGDKLAIYGASKQVLSEVIPEGLEPYGETRPDEEVSLFVSPSAILKRMIPSLLITATGNKILVELKRKIKEIWESRD